MLCSWLQDSLGQCFTNCLLIPIFQQGYTFSLFVAVFFSFVLYVGHLRPFHDFAFSEKTKNQNLSFQSLSCKRGIIWSSFFVFPYGVLMHFALNDNLIKTRKCAEVGSQTSDIQTGFKTGSLEVTEMHLWVKHFYFFEVMMMVNRKL